MEKYMSSGVFKNYLVFTPAKRNALNISVALLGLVRENLMEFQNKILEI